MKGVNSVGAYLGIAMSFVASRHQHRLPILAAWSESKGNNNIEGKSHDHVSNYPQLE
jgi:hypothetical protein